MTPLRLTASDEPAPGAVVPQLPVFPLPNVVFFPGTLLPLHIFEPRYRAMIRHVMETDQRMAVALLRPGFEPTYEGAPAVHPVMCMGEVVTMQELPDGRSNVLLRGLARVKVLKELTTPHAFRVLEVQVLADEIGGRQGHALATQLATVRQLFGTVVSRVPQLQLTDAGDLFQADADPAYVIDAVASAIPADPERKQELLAERDLVQRGALLSAMLAEAVADTLSAAHGQV
jgi:Lon protease-like protein